MSESQPKHQFEFTQEQLGYLGYMVEALTHWTIIEQFKGRYNPFAKEILEEAGFSQDTPSSLVPFIIATQEARKGFKSADHLREASREQMPGLEGADEWFLHDMPQLLERCRADARRVFGGDRLLERWVGEVREVRAETFVADWVTTIAGGDNERAEFRIDETIAENERERLVEGAIVYWLVFGRSDDPTWRGRKFYIKQPESAVMPAPIQSP